MRSPRPWCFSHPTTAVTSRDQNCLWMVVSHKCRSLHGIDLLSHSLLRSGFKVKESDRHCQLFLFVKEHIDRHYSAVVSGNAAVVTEEHFGIAGQGRLIDLEIHESATPVHAPRKREFRHPALRVTPTIKNNVPTSIHSTNSH